MSPWPRGLDQAFSEDLRPSPLRDFDTGLQPRGSGYGVNVFFSRMLGDRYAATRSTLRPTPKIRAENLTLVIETIESRSDG